MTRLLLLTTALAIALLGYPPSQAGQSVCCVSEVSQTSGEQALRDDIKLNVRRLFRNARFDELEAMARHYRDNGEPTNSGIWRLTLFYYNQRDFDDPALLEQDAPPEILMEGLDSWSIFDRLMEMWLAAYPDSATAHIFNASGLLEKSQELRRALRSSTDYYRDLQTYAWHLDSVRAYLEKHRDAASDDIHWYALRALVGALFGESREQILDAVDEGLERDPYYPQLWFNIALTFFPIFGGDPAGFDAFADTAVERTRDRYGEGMYARLYWYAARMQWGAHTFQLDGFDWERMKTSMHAVLADYPDQWNLQHFANFACHALDMDEARTLIAQVEQPLIERAWYGGVAIYRACRQMSGT